MPPLGAAADLFIVYRNAGALARGNFRKKSGCAPVAAELPVCRFSAGPIVPIEGLGYQASLEGCMMERTQGISLLEVAIVVLVLAFMAAISGPQPAF